MPTTARREWLRWKIAGVDDRGLTLLLASVTLRGPAVEPLRVTVPLIGPPFSMVECDNKLTARVGGTLKLPADTAVPCEFVSKKFAEMPVSTTSQHSPPTSCGRVTGRPARYARALRHGPAEGECLKELGIRAAGVAGQEDGIGP